MTGMNVQISVTNLTQLDRHQDDAHRLPVTQQAQNAEIAEQNAHKRISMPVEPDPTDKKGVDPEDGKRDMTRRQQKKRKRKAQERRKNDSRRSRGGSGHFIDVQV